MKRNQTSASSGNIVRLTEAREAPLYSSRRELAILHIPLVRHRLTRVDRPPRVFFRVAAARKIPNVWRAYIKSNKTARGGRGALLFDKNFASVRST